LGKIWTDSLVHDPEALKLLINVMGEDKVMLGTDYPFPLGEVSGFAGAYPGKTICEVFQNDEGMMKKLLFDNALSFLNLDSNNF
jgi:aminocarboxymuconate-semialdehyde decarboxylase